MKTLSIAQGYMVVAVDKKGRISSFDSDKLVCLLAAGLVDLEFDQNIVIKDQVIRINEGTLLIKDFLQPLYNVIKKYNSIKLEKLLEYYMTYSGKPFNELITAIGSSLVKEQLVTEIKAGFLHGRKGYVPERAVIHRVIDMIKSEVLEPEVLTEDVAVLVVLMDKSKVVKIYFSKFEQEEIHAKIAEATETDSGKTVATMVATVDDMMTTIFATLAIMA